MKKSAGLVIIKNKKILLCHPTNSSWKGTYSFPKGQLDKCETPKEAAIRETFEEVGIKYDDITSKEEVIEYVDGNGKVYKKVYYYIVESTDLPNVIDKEQLQLDEIDWAGFLDYKEAKKKIFWRFLPILDYIKKEL